MSAQLSKPGALPSRVSGGGGGGVAAQAAPTAWNHNDQASRLRALVEAVSRGSTAQPIVATPRLDPRPSARTDSRSTAPAEPPLVEVAPRSSVPREPAVTSDRPSIPVIAIASGKGGVGKTSLAVNLSIALTQAGCRATLLDADLGLANADVLCGIVPTSRLDMVVEDADEPTQSAHDPLFENAPPARAMADIAVRGPGGFLLVPGSVGVAQMTRLNVRQRRSLMAGLATLESRSDIILVDTSAGLGADVLSFVHAADATIIVATPEPTSIADAYALMKVSITQARDAGRQAPRLLLVVNQAKNRQEARKVHTRLSTVAERFLGTSLPMLGFVRLDEHARQAVRSRQPFTIASRGCAAARDVRALASLLVARSRAERRGEVSRRGLLNSLRAR